MSWSTKYQACVLFQNVMHYGRKLLNFVIFLIYFLCSLCFVLVFFWVLRMFFSNFRLIYFLFFSFFKISSSSFHSLVFFASVLISLQCVFQCYSHLICKLIDEHNRHELLFTQQKNSSHLHDIYLIWPLLMFRIEFAGTK